MGTTMTKNLSKLAARVAALALAVLPAAAFAAPTNIAQVPLLNINGTGTVKPNLMVLYDNSGSMGWSYLPDYVVDNLCRSGATLASGQRSCAPGDPPYMTSDFNRVYYNPKITYLPPLNADGTSYPSMTSANTAGWTSVTGDGFGVANFGMNGSSAGTINLTNGFPDLKWCNSGGTCAFNTATYNYPDSTYKTAKSYNTNPYYYTINVAEYCTDASLTSCKTVTVGAAAPAGYPVPAKVRWCTDTSLGTCQAKYIGSGSTTYTYPRYSSPTALSAGAYATITIGNSPNGVASTIGNVSVAEAGGSVVISTGTTAVPSGTQTSALQASVAEALAATIVGKTGLTNQYTACVYKPAGSVVPACSTWGITVPSANNVIAVIPIDCASGTSKTPVNCNIVPDDSRTGWGLTVPVSAASTAFINVTGSTSNKNAPVLAAGTKLGSTVLMSSSLTFATSQNPTQIAAAIVAKIGTGGTIKAYVGGNSITNACAAKNNTNVCLVDTTGTTGQAVTMASLSNNTGAGGTPAQGSVVFTTTASANTADSPVPVTTTPIGAGAAIFTRTDIIPGRTSYPKDTNRSDCVTTSGICTYDEEMTNFANWYAYYKTRNQMMKSSLGRAFNPLTGNFRVGFVSLSQAAAGGTFEQLPQDFTGTARSNWYGTLYGMATTGSTPMRPALHNVGKMYADTTNGVVSFPCQLNFTFVTTDGYWNGGAAATVTNNDNVEKASRFCTAAKGCVDVRAQNPQSLADVALYWYNGGSNTGTTSLNPAIDDMSKVGQVPAAAGENSHLHMNTYTLGLGIDGIMVYDPNYNTAPTVGGDFYKLITNATGCPWNGGKNYVWPDPQTASNNSTVQERVDDLWHAAINGHGKYFSAKDPQDVVSGLNEALSNIQVSVGAAAAAATSTPNISQQDNDIFSDTFTTVKWYGELADKKIDPTTGIVGNAITWISSDTVGRKVAASTDSRNIWTMTESGAVKEFDYSQLSSTMQGWFDNKCMLLAQCSMLSTTDRAIVNSGANLVNWLRGQQQYADDKRFRSYTKTSNTPSGASGPVPIVLGDIASSKPAYVRDPRKGYTDASYQAFKSDNAGRQPVVYTAANDGMLHSFDAATGEELFAYVPRITMKKLWQLSSTTYGTNHIFTTDGSPEVADVQIDNVWKTVMVAGLNGGGRGYYALDVTAVTGPNDTPKILWELCADSSVCSNNDPDLGLTFGNPQFGRWNGQWVVFLTSGYNNIPGTDGVSTGNGQGYLYIVDIKTGNILKKVGTGSGDTTTPSGLAKITAITDDPNTIPDVTYIYGGDNQGQMWRFDLTDKNGAVAVVKMGDAGVKQPITTRPDVTLCAVQQPNGSQLAQRVVLFGSGRLLDVPDTSNVDVQSLYLLKDSGSTIDVRGSTMVQQVLSGGGTNTQTFTITSNPVDLRTQNGWYFDWKLNAGERMNLDPQIVSGVASVVTNIPSSSSDCSVGGTSNVYAVDVCNGTGVNSNVVGGTLSNTSAAVGFIIIRLPKGELKMITTTAKGETLTNPISELDSEGAHPVGWRRVKGD